MLDRLKSIGRYLRQHLKVYTLVMKDPRTPKLPRILLWLAVSYTLLPFDIIPDFIPVVGHFDDLIIVPLLVLLALRLIPKEVVSDCRLLKECE